MSLSVVYHYYPSVEAAKDRLRYIIRADREAAQDGRWVRVKEIERWMLPGIVSAAFGGSTQAFDLLRPRYRWQVRR